MFVRIVVMRFVFVRCVGVRFVFVRFHRRPQCFTRDGAFVQSGRLPPLTGRGNTRVVRRVAYTRQVPPVGVRG